MQSDYKVAPGRSLKMETKGWTAEQSLSVSRIRTHRTDDERSSHYEALLEAELVKPPHYPICLKYHLAIAGEAWEGVGVEFSCIRGFIKLTVLQSTRQNSLAPLPRRPAGMSYISSR